MVTIKAVAEQCGCSPATVSKALNGAPDVGPEMVKRIRAAAAELGYVPNAAARALKTSRTYSFGLLFRENSKKGLAHEFFSLMLNGFKRRAEELGYDISFISRRLGDRYYTYAEHARYRHFDGIAIITIDYEDPQVRELVESGVPTVTVDEEFGGCGCVLSDNAQGIRDLMEYVYGMGHRRVAFIHGEDNLVVTHIRVEAFRQFCQERGMDLPEEYVAEGRYHDPEGSGEIARRLMSLETPPTCILFPDDVSYLGGLQAITEMGLSIPEDVSAVGYDGISLAQQIHPRLTTLRQSADLMGAQAAEELSRAVREGRDYLPKRAVIPGRLIPGETVKDLRI